MKILKITLLALGLLSLNSFAMQVIQEGNAITIHGRKPSGEKYIMHITYDPTTQSYEGSIASEVRFSKYMDHEDLDPKDAQELYNEILEELEDKIKEKK